MLIRKRRWMLAIAAMVGFAAPSVQAQVLPCSNTTSNCAEAAPSCCETDEDGGCNGGCSGDDEAAEPFKLFKNCFLEERGINIGGFIAQSYTANFNNHNGYNGPVTFTDKADQYQMNQLYLYGERVAKQEECEWDYGWRGDLLYGSDYRFTTAAGLENGNTGGAYYGLAIPQFFVEAAKGKWRFKAGHFYSPVGYFVVPANGNVLIDMPYTFQYGEPFTHTGATASYTASDNLTLFGGIIRGWDNFSSFNPGVGYLGGLTYKLPCGGTYALVQVYSNEPTIAGTTFTHRYLQTQVYTKPLNDKLTYVLHSDFGTQEHAIATGGNAQWYGANNYLIRKLNDKWTVISNSEWFRDQNGFRVSTLFPTVPNGQGPSAVTAPLGTGFAGNFFQQTFGIMYKPTANLLIRPNVRFDWYNGALPGGAHPFVNGTKSSQELLMCDAILSF